MMSRPSQCYEDRLYIADIGDNSGERDFIRVYFFTNPRANGLTVTYHAYDFSYPDGQHNAETLLVDESGRLFIVTKGRKAAIYEAPAKPEREGVNELEKVGSAPSNVTDGTFLPGGDRIALLTYNSVEVIDATSYEVKESAPIPDQPQAESLTLSLDEKSLLVGSEGKKSKVYAIPVPSEATPTPTPGDSTDPGAETDVPEEQANSWQSQRGTLLAIGLAGFVALVAGTVVALVRSPVDAARRVCARLLSCRICSASARNTKVSTCWSRMRQPIRLSCSTPGWPTHSSRKKEGCYLSRPRW